MTAIAGQAKNKRSSQSPIDRVPIWTVYIGIVVIMAVAMFITATMESARAAAEAAEETAAAQAEAAEGEEVEVIESDFELEDVYYTWSWIIVAGVFSISVAYGMKQHWAFASMIQIALIISLTATFVLIAQQIDRDIYEGGAFALIILTLVQIAFGNISPQANFRQSMIGLAITAVILAIVVGISIWIVPYLIQLG